MSVEISFLCVRVQISAFTFMYFVSRVCPRRLTFLVGVLLLSVLVDLQSLPVFEGLTVPPAAFTLVLRVRELLVT